MSRIYEQGVDTTEVFRIEGTRAGFLAVRDRNPRFALWAKTPSEACGAALRALALASGILTEGGDAKQAPGESLSSPTGEAGDAQGQSDE